MNIFESLPAGDSAVWADPAITLPDGRTINSASWVLTYALRGPVVKDLVAAADGLGWKTTLTAAASADLTPGVYGWAATVKFGAERFTVGRGQLTIAPDLAGMTQPYEARTPAQVALANCEDAMSTFNRTGGKVKKYEIAGRTMEFQTIGELMTLHAFWQAKVLGEQAQDSIANGGGNPRNLLVRFQRE